MAKHIPYEENHRINNGILEKKCNAHYIYFPNEPEWMECTTEYFYTNNKNKNDGLHPECIKCSKAKFLQWTRENKNKHNENNRRAYKENKWDVKGIMRKNAKTRRENGKYLEWQRNNPDKIKEHNQYRQLHKLHDITESEWTACKKYFNNSCAYCGLHEDKHYNLYAGELRKEDLHKEHIDDKGNNDLSNCVPSCKQCNSFKHQFTLDEFYNEDNPNFTEERYNRIMNWIYNDYEKYIK